MEYIGIVFIVLLVVGLVVASIIKAKKASQLIGEICVRRGWRHTRGQIGFDVVSGNEAGVPWELSLKATNDNEDSRTDSGYVSFTFSMPFAKGYGHLTPRPVFKLLTTGVGGALINKLASKMPGSGMLETITRATPFEVNGLPDHVGTGDKNLIQRLISSESASAIRTCPDANTIMISVVDGQVDIKFSHYEPSKYARDLEKLQAVGATLIRASRRP